jgi:hypothetical protein
LSWAIDFAMNYNNLNKYVTPDQVYSHDLNQVLSKTPPRLFKWMLVGIAFCFLFMILSSFLVRDRETIAAKFILQKSGGQNVLVSSADEPRLKKLLNARMATISYVDPANGANQSLQVQIDSFHVETFLKQGEKTYADAAEMNKAVTNIESVEKIYKIYAYLSPKQAAALPSDGVVSFLVRDQLWIKRLINPSRR